MPLEPYRRGDHWWAHGRVEYAGRKISGYLRIGTGAATQAEAGRWCREEEERRIRRFLLGEQADALTFAQAVDLYPADAKTAGYLIPLVETIGERAVDGLTPREIRGLGPTLYPAASTDTWTRQVVTPVRAVRNHAHDLGKAAPIRIKGYTREERVAQDLARGRTSRVAKTPGSWEWLLRFREHADRRHAALAHFMFVTGARVSQSVAMHPGLNLDLPKARALIPAAKGHAARWVDLTPELVAELANLPLLYPRGVERKPKNARLFGFADRSSPRKGWLSACTKAKITPLGFHAAGRHGFGQEMNVRQGIDEKAASKVGGWADTALMKRTYTHAEDASGKVHKALRKGQRAAEKTTRLKLASN